MQLYWRVVNNSLSTFSLNVSPLVLVFPGGSGGGSVRRACSARAGQLDAATPAVDGGGRSYSLAPPIALERCPLRRQHSAGAASSSTLVADDNAGGYGTVKKSNLERPEPSTAEAPPQKSAEGSEGGEPAVIISGRYLAVGGGGAAWERRTSTPTYSSSDMALRPEDAIQPSTPGSPSNTSGRFRFRYSRSFTFRRSISSSSAGNGSRRGSTSPDKGRRAVQVPDLLLPLIFTMNH